LSVVPLFIRSSMAHGTGHALHLFQGDATVFSGNNAADTAHNLRTSPLKPCY
jgi:hypothetical protein